MFDLEKAISTWRKSLSTNRTFLSGDVEELESHLRDHVERLVASGQTEEDAFNAAVRRLGSTGSIESEYRKVRWARRKRKQHAAQLLIWEASLLKSHVKAAFRSMKRQKSYTFINVGGLATGIACCILILLFVRNELSYDRYHANADRTYQVVLEADFWHGISRMNNMPAGLAPLVASARPEIETYVRVSNIGEGQFLLSNGILRSYENDVSYVDAAVFDVFSFPLVEGDPATALAEPFSLVLSETLARKYFGEESAVGKLLVGSKDHTYKVTGVMRDVPPQSQWRPRALVSFGTLRSIGRPALDAVNNYFGYKTYFLLREGADLQALEAAMPAILAGPGGSDWTKDRRFQLQPLPDIYLHAITDSGPQGSVTALYIFSAAALLVLFIACVNYMNLATARSAQRAREVGVRKTVGAHRSQLVRQFLTESVGLALVATVLGLVFAIMLLPLFNQITDKEIDVVFARDAWLLLSVLGLGLSVGILSGSYPALLLSGVRPALVIKGQNWTPSGRLFRTSLVTFQFAITIILIASTVVMQRQLWYAQDVRLGVQPDQVLAVRVDENSPVRKQFEAFEAEVATHPGVMSTSASSGIPSEIHMATRPKAVNGVEVDPASQTLIRPIEVDTDFLNTLGLQMTAGRNFERELDSSRAKDTVDVPFIVNEAFVKTYGLEEPLNASVALWSKSGRIVGVMQDAHFTSIHEATTPLLLQPIHTLASFVLVRFRPGQASDAVRAVEDAWKKFDQERPATYFFLDDSFARLYESERRLTGIFALFSGLSIFVACLGLFGLAAYTAERRTKEIGIRKTMGASVSNIVILLSKTFVRYVAMAFIIACPLAYAGVSRWLQNFAYRVDPGPGTFLLAGGVALLLAVLTVSYQSIKAARAKPVDNLRFE